MHVAEELGFLAEEVRGVDALPAQFAADLHGDVDGAPRGMDVLHQIHPSLRQRLIHAATVPLVKLG